MTEQNNTKGLNSVNQLISVMVKCGVLFEVRTEFLNTIWTTFVFKGHLVTGFLGVPVSSNKCWDGSQIPSCYCMLLMQPSKFQTHQNYPLLWMSPI
jgi:hypothetical protein